MDPVLLQQTRTRLHRAPLLPPANLNAERHGQGNRKSNRDRTLMPRALDGERPERHPASHVIIQGALLQKYPTRRSLIAGMSATAALLLGAKAAAIPFA